VGLLALVLLAAAPVPAQAADGGKKKWMPPQGAFFNHPRAGGLPEYRVHLQIAEAIKHAKPKSTIKIISFSFDRMYIADLLIAAKRRGVRVKIILNDHQVTPAQRKLASVLGKNRTKRSFIYECDHGCRSRGDVQHSKVYMFSRTGGARRVVMVGSVNLTLNSVRNQYNDIWVKAGSRKLYRAFGDYFTEMKKDKPQKPGWWKRKIGKKYHIFATPYHPKEPGLDPIMRILNRVKCTGANGGTGPKGRTIVRVNMHAWNGTRGIYIAKKLRWLYGQGCLVEVMWGWGGKGVRQAFRVVTKRGFVPTHSNGMDTDEDGFIDLYTHQKELLISGHYRKDRSKRLVVTGSSNYEDSGLNGDEIIFQIKDKLGAYTRYTRNFKWIWKYKSRVVGTSPYRGVPGELEPQPKRGGPAWEE
jgi:phosphatidylserine/phosphatidylglycerophosphate/cardiolipin synthase-like enzyme